MLASPELMLWFYVSSSSRADTAASRIEAFADYGRGKMRRVVGVDAFHPINSPVDKANREPDNAGDSSPPPTSPTHPRTNGVQS